MVPKHFYFGHVALALILVFAFQSFAASASTYDKRMPSWFSSSSYFDVVPKPRIGRRSGDFLAVAGASKPPIDYYSSAAEDINQTLKRFGMSMIPMARIGKRNDADYNDEENVPSEFLSPLMARIGRGESGMIPMARIGKRMDSNKYHIPMPRIG